MAGMFAGFCYTNASFVFDLLKVRAQHEKRTRMSYREEIARIYKTDGLNGFAKGYAGLFLRDFPGFAVYFSFYEFSKRWLT